MDEGFPECDELPSRRRAICRGEVLTLEKCNAYRERWSLPPITNATTPAADHQSPTKKPTTKKLRGLGDLVDAFTTATGIKAAFEAVAKKTGKPCGCQKRREKLNQMFPFGEQK